MTKKKQEHTTDNCERFVLFVLHFGCDIHNDLSCLPKVVHGYKKEIIKVFTNLFPTGQILRFLDMG